MNKTVWTQLHERDKQLQELNRTQLCERAEKIIKQGLLDEIPYAKEDTLRVKVLDESGDVGSVVVVNVSYYEVSLISFVHFSGPFLEIETYDDFVSLEDEMACGNMIQLLNDARKKWGLEPDPEVEYILTDIESVETFKRGTHEH